MMNQRKIWMTLAIFFSITLPAQALTNGRHALLIGIQEYHAPVNSLKGPMNDLSIMEQVLRERFQFQDNDFIILKNEQATHTAIENAFKQLTERVQANDFVYIYYSGHGSQTRDLNEDELDQLDETWVSYGARSNEDDSIDNYDVLDDEVDAWLTAVYAKTHNVVFVSDSCHSATVSRGQEIVSRAVTKDEREHPLGRQAYIRPPETVGVRVGAARDQESAIETPIYLKIQDTEAYYGLFTWHWVQSLQQAREGDAWNDVFKRAETGVTAGRGNVQQPQFWGQRELHLGGKFKPLQPTVVITDVDGATITLAAGALSSVTVGSVYRSNNPDNPATLTITETKPFTSYGKSEGILKKGDLMVEETHVYHFAPIKMRLRADFAEGEDAPLIQKLREALQPSENNAAPQFPGYALASESEQAELHLAIVRPKQENGGYIPAPNDTVLPQSFADQPPQVWILTPEHRLLHEHLKIRFDDPAIGMQTLQENLNKYARVRELKNLSSPGVTPEVMIDVYHLSREDCAGQADCVLLPEGRGWHRKSNPFRFQDMGGDMSILPFNERFTFTLRNESKNDYYCYLLDMMPDGTIGAIFPDPTQPLEDALIEAGETHPLIQESSFIANMTGQETLKFIITRKSFDVSLLESQGFQKRGGSRGEYNPLEQLLVNELYGQRGTDRYQIDEWATEQVSFEVK